MYVKLNVITDSRREVVEKTSPDHYKLQLKEPAERNLANKRILEIFKQMNPGVEVRMVSGHHSPSKILRIGE